MDRTPEDIILDAADAAAGTASTAADLLHHPPPRPSTSSRFLSVVSPLVDGAPPPTSSSVAPVDSLASLNSGESGREKRPLDMERIISVSRPMRAAELSSLHRLLNTTSDTMMRCLCLSSSGDGALAGASSSACFGPAAPANLADGTRSTKMSRRSRPLAASSSKRPEDRPSSPKTMRALEGYLRPSEASSASTRARQSGQLALDSSQRSTQARWKAWRQRGRRRRWSASSKRARHTEHSIPWRAPRSVAKRKKGSDSITGLGTPPCGGAAASLPGAGAIGIAAGRGVEDGWQNLAYMRRRKVREKIMVKMPTTMATLGRNDTLMPAPGVLSGAASAVAGCAATEHAAAKTRTARRGRSWRGSAMAWAAGQLASNPGDSRLSCVRAAQGLGGDGAAMVGVGENELRTRGNRKSRGREKTRRRKKPAGRGLGDDSLVSCSGGAGGSRGIPSRRQRHLHLLRADFATDDAIHRAFEIDLVAVDDLSR